MSILSSESFEYNGSTVRVREQDQWISLTDLWKAVGSPTTQRPNFWLHQDETKALIVEISKCNPELHLDRIGSQQGFSNADESGVWETRKGRGGGTYACRELALEYASYLSVEIRAWLLRVGIERIEEDASPDLAYARGRDRAVTGWQHQGLSTADIYERIDYLEGELRENYEEIEDRRLPGDDMYLPYGVN